jgi:hypothetical protein
MKEAKSLQEHQRYGGGPKWRSTIIMWLVILAFGTVECLRFIKEVAAKDRVWFLALVAGLCVLAFYFKHKMRRKTGQVAQLEISERELVFSSGNERIELLWSAISQCLETPNLFVIFNRSKSIFYAIPKRAFPDERSQEWFRALANQPRTELTPAEETMAPGRFTSANGIALTLQLKFRDYLIRNFASLRFTGVFLGLIVFMAIICFFSTPPPDAVNSNAKTFGMMTAAFSVIWPLVTFVTSFISWRAEKTHLAPQQIMLSSAGIEFADRDGGGRLPWDTYKYYREGRWTFFLWQPRGSVWLMFPKRAFASPSDLEQCRSLLQANLKYSRWFHL